MSSGVLATRLGRPQAALAHGVLRWATEGLVAVALVLVYTFFATGAGSRFTAEPPYYDMLARSFLAGQLHLPVEPHPTLLALPDPYDPEANALYKLWDASLYKGRYYLYWGPLPAVVRAGWAKLTGQLPGAIPLHVGTALLAVVAYRLILGRLAQALPSRGSSILVGASTVAFALGGLLLYLLSRPSIWHEPLVFGIAGALWSWYAFLRALESRQHAVPWLGLAGLCLGAAAASRILTIVYVAPLLAVLAGRLWRGWRTARRQRLVETAAYLLPLGLTALLLGAYNWVRFDSPTQFGLAYALQGSPEFYHFGYQTSVRVEGTAMANALLLYLTAVPTLSWFYPFLVHSVQVVTPESPYLLWPQFVVPNGFLPALGLYVELPMVSLFLLAPMSLGTVALPFLVAGRRPRMSAALRSFAAALGVSAVLAVLTASIFHGVTLRYFSDFLPAWAVAGALGLLWLAARWRGGATRRGQALLAVTGSTCALAAGLGLLIGPGVWQYSLRERAFDARMATEEVLARLEALWPGYDEAWLTPTGRTFWRTAQGRTWADGTIYLRAPTAQPLLVVDFQSEVMPARTLAVRVNGTLVHEQRLGIGRYAVVTAPLAGVAAGDLVAVQLTLADPPARAGEALPIIVSRVGLARDEAEAAPYRPAD